MLVAWSRKEDFVISKHRARDRATAWIGDGVHVLFVLVVWMRFAHKTDDGLADDFEPRDWRSGVPVLVKVVCNSSHYPFLLTVAEASFPRVAPSGLIGFELLCDSGDNFWKIIEKCFHF